MLVITQVTYKQLKDVLLDPKGLTNKESYFTIDPEDTDENLTVIKPGKVGTEFNKTIGYVHRFNSVLIYRCIYGHGLIIIQRNDELGEAKDIRVSGLRPGVEIEVPAGYAHNIINTGRTFLATVDNAPKKNGSLDYETVSKKHGLAYYVIDKKGDIAFEKNLSYSFHPQITTY